MSSIKVVSSQPIQFSNTIVAAICAVAGVAATVMIVEKIVQSILEKRIQNQFF